MARYYIQNNLGDEMHYQTNNIVDAIYTAWNIEGCLWLGNILVFDPFEDNENLSDMLKGWGLRVIDRNGLRKLQDVATGIIFDAPWEKNKQI